MPRASVKKKETVEPVEIVENKESPVPTKKPRLTITVRKKLVLSIDDFRPKQSGNILLTCGSGDIGQLGRGEQNADEKCSTPKRIMQLVPQAQEFLQIAAGSFHTVVLTADHQVYTCGCNDDCALGRECFEDDGKTKRVDDQDFMLRPVEALKNYVEQHGPVVQISAGDSHTAALTENGSVLVWGTFRDKQGCLGMTANGDASDSSKTATASKTKASGTNNMKKGAFVAKSATPALVSSYHQRTIVKIASGFNHLSMLGSDGLVYTLGAGDAGQLGRLAPQFRDSSSSDRTKSRMLLPQVIAPEHCRSRVLFTDIWCAGYCCFARSQDNSIFVWGLNNYFQLGYVPNDPEQTMLFYPIKSDQFGADHKWRQFSGDHHIVAVDDQNCVSVIGRGDDSRLGLGGENKDKEQQTRISLKSLDGEVLGVAAGNNCSFAWKKDGSVCCWGCDMEGEMGLNLDDNEVVPEPTNLTSDTLEGVKILQASVGGQHTVFLGKSTG